MAETLTISRAESEALTERIEDLEDIIAVTNGRWPATTPPRSTPSTRQTVEMRRG